MLQDQIKALTQREEMIKDKIDAIEDELKRAKSELGIIAKAKKSLTRLEEQLNEQVDTPDE